MGIETGAALIIGAAVSAATAAATTFVSIRQAKETAEAQNKAVMRTLRAEEKELTRRQERANVIAEEQKADVIRNADRQLGSLRVAGAAVGASHSSFARMVAELGAAEGVDVGRIESNRKSQQEALQQDKQTTGINANNEIVRSFNQSQARTTSAILGFTGSALQIGANYASGRAELDRARNRTSIKRTPPPHVGLRPN